MDVGRSLDSPSFGIAKIQAGAATLRAVAADPRHLGAEIGVLSILHTCGQTLVRHPHVHCVVPAGGLSPGHQRWIHPKYAGFFLPVKVLSRVFRILTFLQARQDPAALAAAARRLIFLKGTDSHDYKYSSAVFEDHALLTPAWRDRYLAAAAFHLKGSTDPDNRLVQRTRVALS